MARSSRPDPRIQTGLPDASAGGEASVRNHDEQAMDNRTVGIYCVCPNHGDIFVHEGATFADPPDYTKWRPVHPEVKRSPRANDPVGCPICGAELRYREQVHGL